MTTAIEWTRNADGTRGETWNPTLGCSRVSPGCDGCYAIGVAHRAMQPAHEGLTIKRPGERTDWTGEVRCLPERLDVPLRRRKPTTFFVDSMSDLFHPKVPVEFIAAVWRTMDRAEQHTFQVLTKRPQGMALVLNAKDLDWAFAAEVANPWPLDNVWLGTSIESDRYFWRADHLRATPAAVRFLSLEPLLGPLPSLDLTGIDWVIVGGESGPGARPMHPDWVRDIRDRCVAAGVPFFFKQWGHWGRREDCPATWKTGIWLYPDGSTSTGVLSTGRPHGAAMFPLGKKVAGRHLDGRTWDEMPRRSAG